MENFLTDVVGESRQREERVQVEQNHERMDEERRQSKRGAANQEGESRLRDQEMTLSK